MVTSDYVVIFVSELGEDRAVRTRVQWRDGSTTVRMWDTGVADDPVVPVLGQVDMRVVMQGSIFERAQTYIWSDS
jgi:hypothetical protein